MALPDQMIRAARLDTSLYEEVEADTTQTTNALTVVAIAAVASGIGAAIAATMSTDAATAGNPILGLVGGVVAALVWWAMLTGGVYIVGTKLLGGTATWGEVMRTVGFANSPAVLNILAFIPVLGGLISLVVSIWTLVATVIGIRQALDVGTGKAIVAAIIGGILAAIVLAIIGTVIALPVAMTQMATSP